MRPVRFILNGSPVVVERPDALQTLSQWLRASGRTGTKEGCAEGDCGACTVLLSDVDAKGAPCWRAVNSCITLLPLVDGHELKTVEGLEDEAGLHPVQAALAQHHGSQCGYCTPGITVALVEAYESGAPAAPAALCSRLDGNLCRCTGYRPIREAGARALRCRDGADHGLSGVTRREPRPPGAGALEPLELQGRTRFLRPTSLEELLALLARHAEARLVAGATEIGVEVRKKMAVPPLLISTEAVAVLRGVVEESGHWHVGGGATLSQLEEVLLASSHPTAAPILKMLRVFASRPIRNRATLAGNLATASPIGDLAPVLLALDAVVVVRSASGARRIPIERFFVGYRKTALLPGELIETVELPKLPASATFDTFKVSKRRDLDISIVAAALRVDLDDTGVVRLARLAYGGVAAQPVRATRAEAFLVGKTLEAALHDVLEVLRSEFTPIDDVRAGKEYRRGLVASLFEKLATGARSDAQDGAPRFVETDAWQSEARSRSLPHDSALAHVTGRARYVDDTAQQRPMLDCWPVLSPVAHGTLVRVDVQAARAMPGVVAVLTAADIPGDNDVGAVRHDEPLLADEVVQFHGQPVALVVGEGLEACRRAAAAVKVEVTPLPAVLGLRAAMEANSFHTEPHVIARGDVAEALARSPHRLSGELHVNGQEHFYLETHAAWAEPGEAGDVHVSSSTQHPSEVQAVVGHVLGLPRHQVVVSAPRMGGGFGGKETQGNAPAAWVALAATRTGRPVRIQLERDLDMQITGKRHPMLGRFEVGFDDDGRVRAFSCQLVSDGGFALDLSESIMDRALFHLDNAYHFEAVRFEGRVARTHSVSNTAFRGFGGPQGILVVEDVLARVAAARGLPPELVRERNFYPKSGATTHYGQPLPDHRVPQMWRALLERARFVERRRAVDEENRKSRHVKRGLAITPVKFGISFTHSVLNQAGALVLLFRDGTAQVNHGGTEMGQGLNAKIAGVVMRELGLSAEHVRVMKTQTDKVPNTSATAASTGADLNGAAVKVACEELRRRLAPVAARLLKERGGGEVAAEDVVFLQGFARQGSVSGSVQVSLAEVCNAAWTQQLPLSATGFYRTPGIAYDRKAGRGRPFHYFAHGVAVCEVELDGLTGMKKVRRVDILHDVGDSLNPSIDRGQIEGAFVQGMGWLCGEELRFSDDGRLLTHSASTYAIPAISDAPDELYVELLADAPEHSVVHGSKAVGEPPLMLAIAVREALRDAVGAFGGEGPVLLPTPLSHAALWQAVQARRGARP
ncbi:MAG: xanthine dehydrogenase molybdopterin binding subunit [Deltaproteobacteria bacterium]|nr:xanthine dehydrogenase molybdopterin binding subunit [Deltaproteobacteria bacterium]